MLVTTALGQVSSGTRVSIAGQKPQQMANSKGQGKGDIKSRLARMPVEVERKD